MTDLPKEEVQLGTYTALLKRGALERIPKLLDLQQHVGKGLPLSDYDIRFLSEVFEDAQRALSFVDRHPELRDMTVKCISLYEDIMHNATENEGKNLK